MIQYYLDMATAKDRVGSKSDIVTAVNMKFGGGEDIKNLNKEAKDVLGMFSVLKEKVGEISEISRISISDTETRIWTDRGEFYVEYKTGDVLAAE